MKRTASLDSKKVNITFSGSGIEALVMSAVNATHTLGL